MNCGNCSKPIGLDEKFCGYCGYPRPKLPPLFEDTESKYKRLKARFQAGELVEAGFQEAMKELIFQDDKGSYWMIGSESEQWFRFDGNDWVQAEPPVVVSSIPEKEPVKVTAPAPPSTTIEPEKPKRGGSCSRSCLITVAVIAGLVILLAGAVYLAWHFFQNELVNFAVKQGWGEIVEPTAIPVQPISPASLQPTAIPEQWLSPGGIETQETWVLPPVTPIERWETQEIPELNLVLDWPENYLHEYYLGDMYLWIADPNPEQALSLIAYFEEDPFTTQADVFLQQSMGYLPEYDWVDISSREIPIGQLVWSEAILEYNLPIFMGVIGPLRDGNMIQFEGQCYGGNWDQAMEIWMEVIESFRYLQ
jgi:hypothetical protein